MGLFIDDIWCSDLGTFVKETLFFSKDLFQSDDACAPHSLLLNYTPHINDELVVNLIKQLALMK